MNVNGAWLDYLVSSPLAHNHLLSQLLNSEEQSRAHKANSGDRRPVARVQVADFVKFLELVERKEIYLRGRQKRIDGQDSDSVEKIKLDVLLALMEGDGEEVGDGRNDNHAEPHHL